jgi:hypothetical protein
MEEHQAVRLSEDERRFVLSVQESMRDIDTRLADDPALFGKLVQAYVDATRLGLTRDALLADFLYLEIQAPGFHRHPAIRTWLTQPGATADERFADLIDVLRNKSQQLTEST